MNNPNKMNKKTIIKIFLWLAVIGLLIYVFAGMTGSGGQDDYLAEERADGEGMTHLSFTEDNKVALELKCRRSNKGENDRIYMEQIEGLIHKKGRMSKDIKIYGDKGYAENNNYDFFAEGNAKLSSADFTVTSHTFHLKDKAELRSAPLVNYRTKSMKGTARAGMEFFLNVNTLKFFDTNGTYKRDNKSFGYRAKTLWFIDEEKVMVLEKEALIRDTNSIVRSDWITIHFDDELKDVKETTSQKNSYLFFEDKEKGASREIRSENIRSLYDEEGRLSSVSVIKDAKVILRDPANRTTVSSDTIDMFYDPPTGKAKKVVIPNRGMINNKGKTRFRVMADSIEIDYDKNGEMKLCKGSHNTRFVVEDYRGVTGHIEYDIPLNKMLLQGENTQLISKQNTFYSSQFNVDTENKILMTNNGVKSVIRLEKDSVLFSRDSIFINAQKLKIFEKENKFIYDKTVNLNQGDVSMEAKTLEIGGDNSIKATGRVSLSFKSKDKDITIKGELLVFDSKTRTIDIQDRAAIKSGENVLRANTILIRFDDRNEVSLITGEDKINFLKDDLSGYSDRVEWDFKQDVMVLKGTPRISRENGGHTTGKVLKINLETNKITILSGDSERTETIIR
jgi:lipopolysaccharide transport protein LptA